MHAASVSAYLKQWLSMGGDRVDLSEVSVDDLLAEVQRRLDCQLKPEKRLILIGDGLYASSAAPDPCRIRLCQILVLD